MSIIEPEVVRNVGLIKGRGRTLTPAALELHRLLQQRTVQLPGH
jgi:hypothetical protein